MQNNDKEMRQKEDFQDTKMCEYLEFLEKPGKVLWTNFIRGVASGLGMAIGFTILGALVLFLLKSMVKLNLPLVGQYIAELVRIVQENMRK